MSNSFLFSRTMLHPALHYNNYYYDGRIHSDPKLNDTFENAVSDAIYCVVETADDLNKIKNTNTGYIVYVSDRDCLYVKNNKGSWDKLGSVDEMISEKDMRMMVFNEYEELKRKYSDKEIESIEAENKRLKKQLKELREVIAKFEKVSPESKNNVPQVNISMENINEKILEVKARTLCDSSIAKDYLERCNYDVEAAITAINWSILNGVSKEIL